MSVRIQMEEAGDTGAVFNVNRLAFGRDDEAKLVDELREEGYVRASLVVEDAGQLVGHILFSELPIVTRNGTIGALSLAPLAVVPARQRQGIGSMLVREGLIACAERGYSIVIVLGHPEFYPRFGFSADLARTLESPFSGEAFMALELSPGALEGVEGKVQYPPPFGLV